MTSLFFIVRRSLRQHLLSTVITVIAAGLASGLVMSVFNVSEQSRSAFTDSVLHNRFVQKRHLRRAPEDESFWD